MFRNLAILFQLLRFRLQLPAAPKPGRTTHTGRRRWSQKSSA